MSERLILIGIGLVIALLWTGLVLMAIDGVEHVVMAIQG